jgi:hypothetical protein
MLNYDLTLILSFIIEIYVDACFPINPGCMHILVQMSTFDCKTILDKPLIESICLIRFLTIFIQTLTSQLTHLTGLAS